MNFTRFVGTEHTLQESQEIFEDAKLVVATHGGALLNMVFMQPGTSVIEIGYYEQNATRYNSMRHPPWYFVMSQLLGVRYSLVFGPGAYNREIDCPTYDVLQAMSHALTRPPLGRALQRSNRRSLPTAPRPSQPRAVSR